MGNDKISTCIKDWIDIHEQRLSNMNTKRVRIETNGESYYGFIQINSIVLTIVPDDPLILGNVLNEPRLEGVNEMGNRGIKIVQRFGRPSIYIYFKSTKERKIILKKLRILIGDESTSESSESNTNTSSEGSRVSTQTTRNRLRKRGMNARRPTRIPLLSPAHRKARRFFAEHLNWTMNQWSNVIFTDESRFLLNHIDGRVKVCRRSAR
ncbi:uncharacterized protein [Euwallacea similis]|uniref:uncharacterized protein isoform X2 n=1 Tax=Euwallacea similis TaxID=1736056 RepID=UPI0034500F47